MKSFTGDLKNNIFYSTEHLSTAASLLMIKDLFNIVTAVSAAI